MCYERESMNNRPKGADLGKIVVQHTSIQPKHK